MQLKFSDRYGYTSPRETFVVEDMPTEVINAICSALDDLYEQLYSIKPYEEDSLLCEDIEGLVWRNVLKRRKSEYNSNYEVIAPYLKGDQPWYEKLNLVEYIVHMLHSYVEDINRDYARVLHNFIERLNADFEDLCYGYRIVDYLISPITNNTEIKEIEQAIGDKNDNVHVHLENALMQFTKRPDPDYRNSIKESISAVECLCRRITGESTLDKALPKLKNKGVQMNAKWESGLKELYYYTNDSRTGVRHALMEDSYTPTQSEAQFMLVTCSAFVNYIKSLHK